MAAPTSTRKATVRLELDEAGEQLTALATAALQKIERGETWTQWLDIGRAIDHARTLLMRQLHLNRPTGPAYSEAIGAYLTEYGLDRIDKGVRSRLQNCLDNLPAIEHWRETILDRTRRAEINHPNSVWRAWQAWQASQSMPAKGAAPAGKNAEIIRLQEELDAANAKLQRIERDQAGELFSWAKDRPEDIVRAMVESNPHKASRVFALGLNETKPERPIRRRRTEPAKSS